MKTEARVRVIDVARRGLESVSLGAEDKYLCRPYAAPSLWVSNAKGKLVLIL
jgi:hypothetical protein